MVRSLSNLSSYQNEKMLLLTQTIPFWVNDKQDGNGNYVGLGLER